VKPVKRYSGETSNTAGSPLHATFRRHAEQGNGPGQSAQKRSTITIPAIKTLRLSVAEQGRGWRRIESQPGHHDQPEPPAV
jgi:hypothetical protein